MTSFRHLSPAFRIFHGDDSLKQLPRELERLQVHRAVIFCGASLAREGAALGKVQHAAGERCLTVYPSVVAHSPLSSVEAAAEALRRFEADAVIAVGGGSAVVTARAASILFGEGGEVHRLCTARDSAGVLRSPRLDAAKIPQIVIPTTPTTATLKAGSAVLDTVTGARLPLFDPKTRAASVFLDPELIATPPRSLVVSSSLNTLTMAVEGLLSRAGDAFSDALLIHVIRQVFEHLPNCERDPRARSELMMASLLCGHGTDYTGAGIALPLGHAISARFHLDNGTANAIVLPHVIRYNAEAAVAGVRKLASALALAQSAPAEDVITKFIALFAELSVPTRLRDVGLPGESLSELAAISMGDWFVRDNPRSIQEPFQLLEVLKSAW
jgi:alcohol dehydrogenase class IV